jgi:hypothetical protein
MIYALQLLAFLAMSYLIAGAYVRSLLFAGMRTRGSTRAAVGLALYVVAAGLFLGELLIVDFVGRRTMAAVGPLGLWTLVLWLLAAAAMHIVHYQSNKVRLRELEFFRPLGDR